MSVQNLDTPLDVWLRFEKPGDETPSHEANTFRDGKGGYRVDWSHTAVGQVMSRRFTTRKQANAWLEAAGYQDFSS